MEVKFFLVFSCMFFGLKIEFALEDNVRKFVRRVWCFSLISLLVASVIIDSEKIN